MPSPGRPAARVSRPAPGNRAWGGCGSRTGRRPGWGWGCGAWLSFGRVGDGPGAVRRAGSVGPLPRRGPHRPWRCASAGGGGGTCGPGGEVVGAIGPRESTRALASGWSGAPAGAGGRCDAVADEDDGRSRTASRPSRPAGRGNRRWGEDGAIAVRLSSGLAGEGAGVGRPLGQRTCHRLAAGRGGGLPPRTGSVACSAGRPEQCVHSRTRPPRSATDRLKFAGGEVHAASAGT